MVKTLVVLWERWSTMSKSITIHELQIMVTNICNMKCEYCFADRTRSNKDDPKTLVHTIRSLISLDVIAPRPFVTLTGGEPTLRPFFISEISNLFNKYNISPTYHIQTNGYSLDNLKKTLLNTPIKRLTISMDGLPEVHDSLRKDPNGNPTYEMVHQTAKWCITLHKNNKLDSLVVQPTITKYSSPLSETLLHLVELGFNVIAPSIVFQEDNKYGMKFSKLLKEYLKFHYHVLDSLTAPTPFIDSITLTALKNILFPGTTPNRCKAGKRIIGLSSSGEVYPCSTLAGMGYNRIYSPMRDSTEKIVKKIQEFSLHARPSSFCLVDTFKENTTMLYPTLIEKIEESLKIYLNNLETDKLQIFESNLRRLLEVRI